MPENQEQASQSDQVTSSSTQDSGGNGRDRVITYDIPGAGPQIVNRQATDKTTKPAGPQILKYSESENRKDS
jgi:hypothetical protein